MTNYLVDVNVWVAIAVAEHVHHAAALLWLSAPETGQIGLCRVTQQGLLRLLSNPRVMGGDALSAMRAWAVYDGMFGDARVRFFPEPAGLESHWRQATRHRRTGPNFWTDAYLSAFAAVAGLTLVTFDRAFAHHSTATVRVLAP